MTSRVIGALIPALCVLGTAAATRADPAPADLRARALTEVQEASHRSDRAAADSVARSLVARWPDDPTGYYARAVLSQVRGQGCEDARPLGRPDADLARAATLAEAAVRARPSDVWSRYILGLALGFQSMLAARDGHLWQAWRTSRRSLDELDEVLRRDPTFVDAWLPVGTYHFWVGSAVARWRWLPGIEDTRAQGIAELRRAASRGRMTQLSANSMLVWALLAYDRQAEALRLADSLLVRYPGNRSFLWARVNALLSLRRWTQAEAAATAALETFGPEEADCPGPARLRASRGIALAAMGRCAEARPLLDAALRRKSPAGDGQFAALREEATRWVRSCEGKEETRR